MSTFFGKDRKNYDECNCDCHKENEIGVKIRHFFACCDKCPTCGRRIIMGAYELHVKNCKEHLNGLTNSTGPK